MTKKKQPQKVRQLPCPAVLGGCGGAGKVKEGEVLCKVCLAQADAE